jgi:hypothetical protein
MQTHGARNIIGGSRLALVTTAVAMTTLGRVVEVFCYRPEGHGFDS